MELSAFAQAALHSFEGKYVEINTGEVRTIHLMDQFQHNIPYVIRGTLLGAVGDALIIKTNTNKGFSKEVLINCAWIRSMTSLEEQGSLKDVYWDLDKRLNK